MRKVLIYAFVLITILYLTEYKIKDHAIDIKTLTSSPYTVNDRDDIKMSMVSLKGTEITLSIEYSSEASGLYGEFYAIELKDRENWYSLPHDEDVMFTAVGHTLQQDQTDQWSVDFSHLYGDLPIGKYRIVKDITIGGQEYFVSTEFSIK